MDQFDSYKTRFQLWSGGLGAAITIETHRLEKGMSLDSVRPGFGQNVAKRLCNLLDQAENYAVSSKVIDNARMALFEYDAFLSEHGIVLPFVKKWALETGIGGTHPAIPPEDDEHFLNFIKSRRSFRTYTKDAVPVKLLEKAVRVAQTAPSVCNRQTCRVFYLTGDDASAALKLQNGNNGFKNLTTVLIVTSCLSDFHEQRERNQPFVDGGLFAMTLSYALLGVGLGNCFLNWCAAEDHDRALRELAGIPANQVVISLMAVGFVQNNSWTTSRSLLPLNEVFNQVQPKKPVHHLLSTHTTFITTPQAKAFNGSIFLRNGTMLFAYRYYKQDKHDGRPGKNRISIGNLTSSGDVVRAKPFFTDNTGLGRIKDLRGIDDPRLFEFNKKIHCAITVAASSPYRTIMAYGEIRECSQHYEFVDVHVPQMQLNDGNHTEKNWQFFEAGGDLYAYYDFDNGVILKLRGSRIENVIYGSPINWKHGEARGGTPPIAFDDNLLITFFHASQQIGRKRVYNMGCLVFHRSPPFKAVYLSRVPIMDACSSVPNDGPFKDRLVIFPAGACRVADGFVVSVGVNDSRNACVRLAVEDLSLEKY